MPRKLTVYISIVLFSFLFFSFPRSILSAPTITPADTTAPTGAPTCDLCGWCNRYYITPTPAPPANWQQCSSCLYDASGGRIEGNYYTVIGCLSAKPEFFVKTILNIVFGIAGGLAFLAFLSGSTIVLTSSGNPIRLQTGKDIIASSLFGLLLIIFAVFLLRLVGFDILQLPGFG